jgi:hypothetical protein
MLLIGLAGGSAQARDEVAGAMQEAGLCRVQAAANYETGRGVWGHDKRLDWVRALVAVTPKASVECLVFSQVLCEAEAGEIRRLGGYVCHVQGVPSGEVPIRLGDVMITRTEGGDRHYLDPVEALSQLMCKAELVRVPA